MPASRNIVILRRTVLRGVALLTPELASAFARLALANVVREYPRKHDHLLTAPHDDHSPRALHPSFYGSYDWHSAVHMHWLLARLLRTHPQLPPASEIAALLDAHLAREPLATELAYFASAAGRTFERPYGWAWLLELHAELLRMPARRWPEALSPLAAHIAGRLGDFISSAPYPIRAGSHGNTAFACMLALDYAGTAPDEPLAEAIRQAARKWYGNDRNCPVNYEPSLDEFLSPALIEATLMREVLEQQEFRAWLDRFLPAELGPLASPPTVSDRTDPKQSHLDGLCLSRAWCLRRLAAVLPEGHERHATYAAAAERLLATGLPHVAGGDYVGEHWLASFAALALGDQP